MAEFLHLFQSAAGWNFSEDNNVKLLFASIAEYQECQGLGLAHRMVLKLTPSFVGYSLGLGNIFISELFVDKTNFRSKDL